MQVIKLNGDHLTFKGRVYGSVGIEYRIEYDKTAFQVEYNCEYVYSKEDRDMLDGADDSTVTYELTPLKKGLFDIYEVEGFRCQETARKKAYDSSHITPTIRLHQEIYNRWMYVK